MLAFASGMIFSATAMPGFALTVPKSEPLILAPYEVAFVQSASCPAGKVLKVTGAIRGLDRRKVCVSRGRLCNGCQATKPKLTDCAWIIPMDFMILQNISSACGRALPR